MTHSNEHVGRYFDKHASSYDDATQRRGWPGTNMLADELRQWPGIVTSALDLGAGTGAAVGVIKEQKNPERIVAVDMSEEMLNQLREKHPDPKIQIARQAIGDYLTSTKETFDLITAMLVMHFLPDSPRNTIGNIAFRLNQGGRLIFTYDPIISGHPLQSWAEMSVPGEDFSVYRQHPDEIISAVQDNGLTVVKEMQFQPKPPETPTYKIGFIIAEKE